jgi:hypothetical protein
MVLSCESMAGQRHAGSVRARRNGSPETAKRQPRALGVARGLDCGGWAATLGDDTPLSRTQHVDKGVDKYFGMDEQGKVSGVVNA